MVLGRGSKPPTRRGVQRPRFLTRCRNYEDPVAGRSSSSATLSHSSQPAAIRSPPAARSSAIASRATRMSSIDSRYITSVSQSLALSTASRFPLTVTNLANWIASEPIRYPPRRPVRLVERSARQCTLKYALPMSVVITRRRADMREPRTAVSHYSAWVQLAPLPV